MKEDERLEELEAELAHLQTELNASDRAAAAALGVGTAEDLQVLRYLLREDPVRVGDLARIRGASVATVSARLDRLERRGFITRDRLPGDRRSVAAILTATGQSAAKSSRNRRLDALAQLPTRPQAKSIRMLKEAIAAIEPAPLSE
jgi:DNA-binding MarR family transcriptional regulator